MSKTKDNVVDPLDLIDEYGADALRFTLALAAGQGRDMRIGASRVEGESQLRDQAVERLALLRDERLRDGAVSIRRGVDDPQQMIVAETANAAAKSPRLSKPALQRSGRCGLSVLCGMSSATGISNSLSRF